MSVPFRGHLAAVLCVRFSDTKIVSGSCDKTIKVSCLYFSLDILFCNA